MSEREKYDLIHRFLNKELSAGEQAHFEAQLTADPALAQEVGMHRAAHEFITDGALLQLKTQMQHIYETEYKGKTNEQSWLTGKIAGIAAGLLLTGSAAYYFSSATDKTSKTSATVIEVVSSTKNAETGPVALVQEPSKTNRNISGGNSNEKTAPSSHGGTGKTEAQAAVHAITTAEIGGTETPKTVTNIPSKGAGVIEGAAILPASSKVSTNAKGHVTPPPTSVSQTEKELINPCVSVRITAALSTEPSCSDRHTGVISIEPATLDGGIPPYVFTLNKGVSQVEARFDNLCPGTYSVKITDAAGCSTVLPETEVGEQKCAKPNTYSFAPQRETLTIATAAKEGEIKILNKAGQTVFMGSLNGTTSFTWDGHSTTGIDTEMGLYLFSVSYNDGTSLQGSITILK